MIGMMILADISIWIILLPLFLGLFKYDVLDKESKLIFYIVLIGAVPQVLRAFINNSPLLTVLYNLYTPIEFSIYFFFFISKINSVQFRKYYYFSALLFFFASVLLLIKFGISSRFLNEWVIINNLIQISWVCLCLLEYYKNDDASIETYQPFFWFFAGITIYSTTTVVFYSLWFVIKSSTGRLFHSFDIIHHIFNIILYIFFSVGFYKNYNNSYN